MAIEVLIPSIIKVGGGAFAEASSILKRLEVKHALIVTDAFLVHLGLAESLRLQIENAGIACGVFFRNGTGSDDGRSSGRPAGLY